MASLNEIKKRIKTVEVTSKITNAMKLVATSKLKQQKNFFANQSIYVQKFYDLFTLINKKCEFANSQLNKDANGKTIWFIIFSTLGLCGSFNLNLVKKLISEIKNEKDELWLFGRRGASLLKSKNVNNEITFSLDVEDKEINFFLCQFLAEKLYKIYLEQSDVKEINIIYTKFINSLNFEPQVFNFLPIDNQLKNRELSDIQKQTDYMFEPNAEVLYNSLMVEYLATSLHGAIVESKVCENASRRNAMDSATKNANTLISNYKLEYNRKRQADITQQITEIVSGSNLGGE
ncbi:MAG: F0F1 ATP synthase subunit gamma [Malacoplasma sp.]|nr:F0F1 ATP synthase subunit gamma [Malacoplasma sp.]